MMELISVTSAAYNNVGGIDFILVADLGNGPETVPFGYQVGDPHGLGPAVAQWLEDNPEATIDPAPEQLAQYRDLPRPSFLFMMGKIGVSEAQVEALIDAMPDSTQQEADAKALALIVFRNQQTFKRDNALLATLTAAAGLSDTTVNAAWKAAEALTW